MIRRNTTVPVSRAEIFQTLYPDQDTIKIEVYQGEHSTASENTLLGEFLITDLKPEAPGELASVTVQFDMDVDGILHTTAQDRVTRHSEAITVQASARRMSETDILEARRWAETLFALSNEQLALLEQAETLLEDTTLEADTQVELETLLADIETTRSESDAAQIEALFEELVELLFELEE